MRNSRRKLRREWHRERRISPRSSKHAPASAVSRASSGCEQIDALTLFFAGTELSPAQQKFCFSVTAMSSQRNIALLQWLTWVLPTSFFSNELWKTGERNELLTLPSHAAGADPLRRRRACDRFRTCTSRCAAAGVLSTSFGRQQDQSGGAHHVRQCSPAPRQPECALRPRADAKSPQLPAGERHRQRKPPHSADFPHRYRHPHQLDWRLWRPYGRTGFQQLRILPSGRFRRVQQFVPVLDIAIKRIAHCR